MVYDIFFFNDTATTEIYTLSLHDALPIYALEIDVRAELDEVRTTGWLRQESMQRDELARGRDHERIARFTRARRQRFVVGRDRKSTRLNSIHANISYAVFCLKKKTYLCNT